MKAKILWVEGKRADSPSFVPDLRRKGFIIEVVPTGNAAQAGLSEAGADLVVINAASLRSSGKRICQGIRSEWPKLPILVIANPDRPMPKDACADVVLKLPFTSRKLVNRILPMLPVVSNNLLQTGPIILDMERRLVRCEEKEGHLTPRLTLLLKLLMHHRGEVLEREQLFRQVWNTEYTGDTRTLDVHISWLRQAIELDPRKPRFLRTIRGVGYRLDV
ncbi:MAG TPA: response regulator transcription factor [Anaerolineales bacterium]|nr:response regulator transcription factor [Anaerolineales bacterium]